MKSYRKILNVLFIFILGHILLSCARDDNSLELANDSNQLRQCISKTNAYTYYEQMESMRKEAPYTYMMNKYLDIALERLYGWDEEYLNMDIETKQSMIDSFANENPKLENTPLCYDDFDKFFNQLNDELIIELNSFDEVRYRIEESLKISGAEPSSIDKMDMIVNIGSIGYSKLDILQAAELHQPLLHESFNIEEELKNTECDCEDKPEYAPPSNHVGPNYLVRYYLLSLWLTDIRYRNYNKTCPDINFMRKAMNEWEAAAKNAIRFREIADNGWNRFTWGIGCNYHVRLSDDGSNGGGVSSICAVPWAYCKIGRSALYGTYLHELGHILGLLHEQMRPDRDCYVDIYWENMDCIDKLQFHKFLSSSVKMYGDFDFESIMLYGSYAFSNNGKPTMKKKDGTTFMAQRDSLSANDIKYIQYLYH